MMSGWQSGWMRKARTRRAVTVPAVATAAALLGGSLGLWAPVATAVDFATAPKKMPRLRLLSFALAWSTLESIGVGATAALWATGHRDDHNAHYALQRWWAARRHCCVEPARHRLDSRAQGYGRFGLTEQDVLVVRAPDQSGREGQSVCVLR